MRSRGGVMRRIAVVLVLVGVTGLTSSTAWAKEGYAAPTATAAITGPRLEAPIILGGRTVWRMLYLTTFRGYNVPLAEPPSPDRRGSPYEVTYYVAYSGEPVRILHQDLYPYARGDAAWAYTAPGQPSFDNPVGGRVQAGWWHSVALWKLLPRWGFPERVPLLAPSSTVTAPTQASAVWASLGIVALLVGVSALASRVVSRREG
ncbi:MAG TPA: hypothetical protein VF984_09505 [Actinomycetota bacterium]